MRIKATSELNDNEVEHLRAMLDAAFDGDFADTDWEHALGGVHFFVVEADAIVSHASVVERALIAGDLPLRTGFVEAVATAPAHRGRGHATRLMHSAGGHIREHYKLGSLCTGTHGFYERLGWERWRGPTFVRTGDEWVRTAEEDGAVMILRTPNTPSIDLTTRLSCEWRPGDVW